MKKFMKVLGITILTIILLIVVLLAFLSLKPYAPNDYTDRTEAGGIIEAKYLARGSYDTKRISIKAEGDLEQFTIFYPEELHETDLQYPVVIMVNGTGVKASKYQSVLKHLASWGFVVVGNEHPSSGFGHSTDQTLEFLLALNQNPESFLFNKIDLARIGLEGHSQGGAGCLTELSISPYKEYFKTAVALSPTHEETAHALGWLYELDKIEAPLLILAGTESEFETEFVIPIDKMIEMFNKVSSSEKAMARRIGSDHGMMLYTADGYATAWLMWQLQGDEEAAKAFIGDIPELLDNLLYQDQRIER